MKNPFPPGQGMLTSGRACAVYALAFMLTLFLDAERFSAFLERVGADFAPAAAIGRMVDESAAATGVAAFSRAESRLVADLAVNTVIGAIPAPGKPAPAASESVADALDDFSRQAALPASAQPEGRALPQPAETSSLSEEAASPSAEPDAGAAGPSEASAPSAEAALPAALPPDEGARKPKVLLVGDSMMMEGFGPVLQRTLRKRPDMEVAREGKYSTGLSREDYFDWPAHLRELVDKHKPDLIVICMGANDPQDIIDENRKRHHADSDSWKTIYRGRAERLLAVATSRGSKVVWAGLPIMGKEPYATRVRRLSRLQKEACDVYRAVFVDTTRVLADERGAYATFGKDGQGRHVRLRYKDMVHVTEDGGALLTAAVVPAIEEALALGKYKAASSAPSLSPPRPHASSSAAVSSGTSADPAGGRLLNVDSALLGRKVACYAFLPADRRPGERFPVVYLLHGAFESGEVWNARAGKLLADLATRDRLVLIAPSCGKTGWYADSPLLPQSRIESFLIRELLPFTERTFPVLPKRGIMGMSMGGHGAFVLALRHPGLFASVSSMSGVLDLPRHAEQWKIRTILGPLSSHRPSWEAHSARHLLSKARSSDAPAMLVTVGQRDAAVLPDNRAFREELRKGGFDYQYRESPGGHDWTYWREEIPLHLAFHAGVLQR